VRREQMVTVQTESWVKQAEIVALMMISCGAFVSNLQIMDCSHCASRAVVACVTKTRESGEKANGPFSPTYCRVFFGASFSHR
jgi:hypothetical protein